MRLNADFNARASAHAGPSDWVASPMPGVERRMLDRIGEEVARATSIVRYAPGSAFSPHTHGGGEEFFVLDGTFQDGEGDYPAGFYVRNPPTSRHQPGAPGGCTILVKLHQFDPADRRSVRVDTRDLAPKPAEGRAGVFVVPLFADAREKVRLEVWEPGASVRLAAHRGLELFVLDGSFSEGGERFARWSWLRLPPEADLVAQAGPEGARLFVKSDHLGEMVEGIAPAP